jgi:hypothetical protein
MHGIGLPFGRAHVPDGSIDDIDRIEARVVHDVHPNAQTEASGTLDGRPARPSDALGNRMHRFDVSDVLAKHRELVTAVPRDDVARSDGLAQERGRATQQQIAGSTIESVVRRIEVVDVDKEDGCGPARLPQPSSLYPSEAVQELSAVVQAGELIVSRPVANLSVFARS